LIYVWCKTNFTEWPNKILQNLGEHLASCQVLISIFLDDLKPDKQKDKYLQWIATIIFLHSTPHVMTKIAVFMGPCSSN